MLLIASLSIFRRKAKVHLILSRTKKGEWKERWFSCSHCGEKSPLPRPRCPLNIFKMMTTLLDETGCVPKETEYIFDWTEYLEPEYTFLTEYVEVD